MYAYFCESIFNFSVCVYSYTDHIYICNSHTQPKKCIDVFTFDIYICIYFFRHNAMAHELQYSLSIAFIYSGKPNNSCDSLYYGGQDLSISEVCLHGHPEKTQKC